MKEVHIIAKGKGWDNAPDDGETWGVNDIILRRDQLSVSFHMHDMEWIKRKEGGSLKLIIKKAEENKTPIITHNVLKWIPTSEAYPLDEVIDRFKTNYFGSSIDYMIALALYRDYDIINLYGVNMVLKKEYQEQKPSLEFWIGMSMGLGKKVRINDGQHGVTLKTFNKKLYGYDIDQFKITQEGV